MCYSPSYNLLFYPGLWLDIKARSPLPMGRIEGSAVSLRVGDRTVNDYFMSYGE
ncbi:hypothetical protein [Laspinema palackyanum]|uniref:hypothetical protein n=1 Tax=Laspinema palackyanum TaxID=3231601 RepID=UPI00345D24C6|nr:hypothetical protein [Laspinema sp. D2c]